MAPQGIGYWKQFEDFVAQIYRVLGGAKVQQNVNFPTRIWPKCPEAVSSSRYGGLL
jgi:hypothetical protein